MYLYETWARADLTYPEKGPYHGEPIEAMGTDLHDGYERAFAADSRFSGVAHVGDAWINAMHAGVARANPYVPAEKPGQLDLWGSDHYHPSIHGSYLAALVLFQEITGVAPHTLGAGEQAAADLGISREDAGRLQTVAETVRPAATAAPAQPAR